MEVLHQVQPAVRDGVSQRQIKGARRNRNLGHYLDLSALSDKQLNKLKTYSMSTKAVLSRDLLQFSGKRRGTILSSVANEQRRRRTVSMIRSTSNADEVMAGNTLQVTELKGGSLLSDMQGKPVCSTKSNVIMYADEEKVVSELVKKVFATQGNAMFGVKSDVVTGENVVECYSTMAPANMEELNIGVGIAALYESLDPDAFVGTTPVYSQLMATDIETLAGITEDFYSPLSDRITENLTAFSVKDAKFLLAAQARRISLAPPKDAYTARQRIDALLKIASGEKKGIGRYCASHLDGIPLSPKERELMDSVSDFRYEDVDVYFIETSNIRLANAINTVIKYNKRTKKKGSKNFGLFYRSRQPLSWLALSDSVKRVGNVIHHVTQSFNIAGNNWPTVNAGLKTLYVSYAMPDVPVVKQAAMRVDRARAEFEQAKLGYDEYTRYQMYVSHLAIRTGVKDGDTGLVKLVKAQAEWGEKDEYYLPSARIRHGVALYCSSIQVPSAAARSKGQKYGLTGMEMMTMISSGIYHSKRYISIPLCQRKFNGFKIPRAPIYNLSKTSAKKMMENIEFINDEELIELFTVEELKNAGVQMEEIINRMNSQVEVYGEEKVEERTPERGVIYAESDSEDEKKEEIQTFDDVEGGLF